MTDAQPVLTVDRLSKQFQLHARGTQLEAVIDCSFMARAGRVTALVGPSGAGKSTVLKCIHRTYLPSSGALHLHTPAGDIDLAACDDHAVLAARRDHIGFVTQFLHCLPRKAALEVVAEPLIRAGGSATDAHQRAAELLRLLGIPEALWQLPPATFSGGEQQRVNIARGLARHHRLLLLDEPTASLDQTTAERVLDLIAAARDAGSAVIVIMHHLGHLDRIADDRVTIAPVPTPAAATD